MNRLITSVVFAATVISTGTSFAAQKTVKLTVENMYCASCPYIVKESLTRVPGVTEVKISFRQKTALVTFDDSKTDINALTDATFVSGFPSELSKSDG